MKKFKTMPGIAFYIPLKKVLLMAKLTMFLLVLGLLQVSAESYSQTAKLRIKMENVPIVEVFDEIERISQFRFFYDNDLVDLSENVSVDAEGESIADILDKVFQNKELNYEIMDRFILVKSPNGREILSVKDNFIQQNQTVSGKVTDSGGQPLPGVTVVVKGTTNGTVTNVDGNYSLSNIPEDATLHFSFVGMQPQEILVAGKNNIDVVMTEETIGIEEVVAIGYGTQKKVNLTGSVDVVSGEKLENRPAASVSLLLQGTAPNVNISLSGMGGEPGSTQNFNIRGTGSISGNDSPLILVDGVEMDIDLLDPESIESISILKDASASAVYGSRAAYGVVLVTTKQGKTDRPLQIQYSNNLSYAVPLYVPNMEDSYSYATAFNQAKSNAGLSPVWPADQVERIRGWIEGTYPYPYDPEKPLTSFWNGRWQGNANVNWPQKFWSSSFRQKHNINLNGGSKKSQYYFNAGFLDQPGLYTWGNDSYKRYNILSNFSHQVNNWIKFEFNTKYARTNIDHPIGVVGIPRVHAWNSFLVIHPTQPEYYLDGTPMHPYANALQRGGRILNENNDLWLNMAVELEPLKGWKTNIRYNYNYQWGTESQNPKPVIIDASDTPAGNIGQSTTGSISQFNQTKYYLFNIYTSYENTIGNHYFKGLIGYEEDYNNYKRLYGSKMDLITPDVVSISSATGAETLDDALSHWATQGIFGRLNYNYKEKYLLEFSARYDGSSRFASESRWGFFPSFSAGYNIAREDFWAPVESHVNSLKFRVSYGSLGNQNVANYLYLSTIPVQLRYTPSSLFDPGYLINDEIPLYAQAPNIISSDLTWETVTTFDVGFDAGFLKNRLNVVFDWYERITSDMIGPAIQLPSVLGTSAPKRNNAKLSTKGFELSFTWKDKLSSDLSYNVQLSIGDHKTTILEYLNETGNVNTWYNGKIYGDIWGYTTDKMIQSEIDLSSMPDQSYIYSRWTPGDIMYKDLNGDSKITPGTFTLDDHGDLSVIANSTPRYNYNISAGFNWKNFDFNMIWQGIAKQDFFPTRGGWGDMFFGMGTSQNSSMLLKEANHVNYWRPTNETNMFGPNTNAYYPKPYLSSEANKNMQTQSRFVQNAAYLRLKNLQIGYTIPKSLLAKVFIQNARIYVSGENLLTISPLPKAFEPETIVASTTQNASMGWTTVSGQIYPIAQLFSFGVNITF